MTAYAREIFAVGMNTGARRFVSVQPASQKGGPATEGPAQNAQEQGEATETAELIISLRSVNGRFLDLSLNLPRELRGLHDDLTRLIKARVRRGKTDLVVEWKPAPGSPGDEIADADLDFYFHELRKLHNRHAGVPIASVDPVALLALVRGSGSGARRATAPGDGWEWSALLPCFEHTLDQFTRCREREGKAILGHLHENTANCESLLKQVGKQRQTSAKLMRERLLEAVAKLKADYTPGRFEEELLYLIKRHDAEEEHNRLLAHLLALRDLLGLGAGPTGAPDETGQQDVGKRLNFLLQEMTREANTIGSKSPDHETTMLSIEIKLELERMREQVANLE